MMISLKFQSPRISFCSNDYDPFCRFMAAFLRFLQALTEQNNLHCATASLQWRYMVFKCCLYYVFRWMPSCFIIDIIQCYFSSLTSLTKHPLAVFQSNWSQSNDDSPWPIQFKICQKWECSWFF